MPRDRRLARRKHRLRKRAMIVLTFVSIIILSVLLFATYLYIKAGTVFTQSHVDDGREKSELRDATVDPIKDNVSILIMGVDTSETRAGDGEGRTDTLMIATLNSEDKSMKLLSIPRDSYVYIPKVGYETRINHAHAYGGTKATIDTIENLLDIPIDYWIKLTFEAFIDVIDAVDGIEIEVPYELYEQDSKDVHGAIHLHPGKQELNGEEALALARTRKLDNDIERGKRQQEIIKSVVKKSTRLSSVLKYDNIIDAIGGNMTTNMEFSEMKGFASYGTAGSNLKIENYTLAGWDHQPGSMYYWQLDEEALQETKQLLKKHLELE